MDNVGIDFLLNLIAELIGIVITVIIIDRIIVHRREKQRTKPLKERIYSRVADHCGVLGTLIEILALDKKRDEEGAWRKEIIDRKKQLVELSQIGENILEINLKDQLIELDRRLDILLSAHASGSFFPIEEWNRVIDETISQIIVVSKLIGNIGLSIGLEAWLDVFRQKSEENKASED